MCTDTGTFDGNTSGCGIGSACRVRQDKTEAEIGRDILNRNSSGGKTNRG